MSDVLYMSLAVGLTVSGAILSAIGYVLQKKGHNAVIEANEISEITDEDTHSFWSNKIWVSGFIIYAIGSLLIASALKFGAQSVLAPLGALTLVCNALFATKFLNEPFHRNNLFGITLVIIGSLMAVVFGPKSNSDPITLNYIKICWRNIHFLIFFIVLTIIAIIDYILIKIYEHKNYKAMENHKITHGANFLMISYVSLAAYFGSTNVLFMKSAVIIIGSFQFIYFIDYLFYITAFGIIIVNVLLENFRQKALVYFDAIYVVPIYQVLLILGSAIMGAIFFNEFALLNTFELILFTISICITLLGVAILAYDVGSAYKKLLKKLDDKTPNIIHFTKQPALSPRAIRRESFRKRTHRTRQIVPASAWASPANLLAAHYYANTVSFVFNESTLRSIDVGSGKLELPENDDNTLPNNTENVKSFFSEFKFTDNEQNTSEMKENVDTEQENNNNENQGVSPSVDIVYGQDGIDKNGEENIPKQMEKVDSNDEEESNEKEKEKHKIIVTQMSEHENNFEENTNNDNNESADTELNGYNDANLKYHE